MSKYIQWDELVGLFDIVIVYLDSYIQAYAYTTIIIYIVGTIYTLTMAIFGWIGLIHQNIPGMQERNTSTQYHNIINDNSSVMDGSSRISTRQCKDFIHQTPLSVSGKQFHPHYIVQVLGDRGLREKIHQEFIHKTYAGGFHALFTKTLNKHLLEYCIEKRWIPFDFLRDCFHRDVAYFYTWYVHKDRFFLSFISFLLLSLLLLLLLLLFMLFIFSFTHTHTHTHNC
jgi:hypothetical protein